MLRVQSPGLLWHIRDLLFRHIDWSGFYKPKAFYETAAQQHRQGRPPILPGRKFFLFARSVANGNFENLVPRLNDACCNLWLNLETPALHRQRSCQRPWHHFVTGLHVVNMATIQDICHCRQEAVAPACRKLLIRKIPASINRDFGISHLFPPVYQRWEILRVILHVCILHRDYIATDQAKSCAQPRAFSLVKIVTYITIRVKWFFLPQLL